MNAIFGALGRGVVRFRWLIVIIWVVGTIFAVKTLPTLASQVNNNNSDFLPTSAPSEKAAELAKPIIGTTDHSRLNIVASTSGAALSTEDFAALNQLKTNLSAVPTVTDVSFFARSPDNRAAQLLVESSTGQFDQTGIKKLVNDVQGAIDRTTFPSSLTVNQSGEIPTEVANQEKSKKQSNQIQGFTILFILVLLIVIFRAPYSLPS